MGRPPGFKASAIENLLHELRYAPPETLRRQMDAAEALIAEIEPDRYYPEDYVVFRITGYRPDLSAPALLAGDALLADLATFVERVSGRLHLPLDAFAPRRAIRYEEVLARLNVSATTLQRYRKQGLVAHRAILDDGKSRLIYFEDAVERFTRRASGRLSAAAQFSRIDDDLQRRILRRARRYRRSLGYSLNQAADRLARRFDRSLEGVRQLLIRHDRAFPQNAIFQAPGPLTDRQRAVIARASELGIPVARLVRRFGRSRATIYRVVNEARAQRLRAWAIHANVFPTFELQGADEILLASSAVREGFDPELTLGGELLGWIESAQQVVPPDEATETAWIAGLNYLLYSAGRIRDRLEPHGPSANLVDEIETRLRWAALLKGRVMASLARSALAILEVHLGGRLTARPAETIRRLHAVAVDAMAQAVDEFTPGRQRLDGYFAFRLRRRLAREGPVPGSGAAARHRPGAVILDDRARTVYPWQPAVEAAWSYRPWLAPLGDAERTVLIARHGWDGRAPRTCRALAGELDLSPERIAAIEQQAIRAARAARRRARGLA